MKNKNQQKRKNNQNRKKIAIAIFFIYPHFHKTNKKHSIFSALYLKEDIPMVFPSTQPIGWFVFIA